MPASLSYKVTASLPRVFRKSYPHVAAAWEYAEDVCSGFTPACELVRLACQRQLDDLNREGFPYYFDAEAAEKVCRFIEKLPHVKGDWARGGALIVLEPWQCFFLTTIFGWMHAEDRFDEAGKQTLFAGTRRFRTAQIEIPRKNAKSTLAAGVGLYMVAEDAENGAEVYSNATTRDQAKIVFDVARHMAMRADLGLEVSARAVYKLETASHFKPLHAQGETLDGYNIHCAINDELHAWKKRAVYDVVETAMGARRQPLMFNITTAGFNLEGICFEIRTYGVRVLKRQITNAPTGSDESFFMIAYTIDEGDDPFARETWIKANPNYGVSVYPLDLEAMARKAREVPSELNAFLTKRLNVWVNAAIAWMDMLAWQRCYDATLALEQFKGEPCYGGIDLASKIDINSLAVIFVRTINEQEHYYAFMRHWLPEAAIADDRFGQYDGYVRMGAITKTDGNVIDTSIIEDEVLAIAKEYSLVELGIDPGHNSTQIGVNVSKGGVTVVDVRPTVLNFSEPMKWLEAWVKEGVFHFCDPVLTWMVSNVVAKRDNKDNIYPRKENVVRKIDGVIAVLIAINRLKMRGEDKEYSVFFV